MMILENLFTDQGIPTPRIFRTVVMRLFLITLSLLPVVLGTDLFASLYDYDYEQISEIYTEKDALLLEIIKSTSNPSPEADRSIMELILEIFTIHTNIWNVFPILELGKSVPFQLFPDPIVFQYLSEARNRLTTDDIYFKEISQLYNLFKLSDGNERMNEIKNNFKNISVNGDYDDSEEKRLLAHQLIVDTDTTSIKFDFNPDYHIEKNLYFTLFDSLALYEVMLSKVQEYAVQDNLRLLEIKRKSDNLIYPDHVGYWDLGYLFSKGPELFTIDSFELLQNVLIVFSKIFQIEFDQVWNAGDNRSLVYRVYDVVDPENESLLGNIFFALNENTASKNVNFCFSTDFVSIPTVLVKIGCDVTIKKHATAKTMFHEIGHAIHRISTRASSILDYWNMKNDLIEIPSLLMEQLATHPEIVDQIYPKLSEKVKKQIVAEEYKMKGIELHSHLLIHHVKASAKISSYKDIANVFDHVFEKFSVLSWVQGYVHLPSILGVSMAAGTEYMISTIISRKVLKTFLSGNNQSIKYENETGQSIGYNLRKNVYEQSQNTDFLSLIQDFIGQPLDIVECINEYFEDFKAIREQVLDEDIDDDLMSSETNVESAEFN